MKYAELNMFQKGETYLTLSDDLYTILHSTCWNPHYKLWTLLHRSNNCQTLLCKMEMTEL